MNYLTLTKNILLFTAIIFIASCTKDDTVAPQDELDGLELVTTFTNDKHTINFYTDNGIFQTGYNAIYYQIKKEDGTLVENATATWQPKMYMTSMSHSCPKSAIHKKENAQATYGGYMVFQMATNASEYWELTLNYTIDGIDYTATEEITVSAAAKSRVQSFMGNDSNKYIVAMVAPTTPIVGINDMKAVIYKMESMMSFTPVENYTLNIDPRMPGMGNHSSPNNKNLTQGSDEYYFGELSLTMTGYWKINLQLLNAANEVLKGEAVTDTNESSSIYFELEF